MWWFFSHLKLTGLCFHVCLLFRQVLRWKNSELWTRSIYLIPCESLNYWLICKFFFKDLKVFYVTSFFSCSNIIILHNWFICFDFFFLSVLLYNLFIFRFLFFIYLIFCDLIIKSIICNSWDVFVPPVIPTQVKCYLYDIIWGKKFLNIYFHLMF